jgi:phytoene synthase
MWVALSDARARYSIPTRALTDLVEGGLQDLEQQRYATFEELSTYCRRVAGAVGVACTAVYGADQPQRAETMGIALQLINIMRDVAEDWRLGRVYIPQDELARHGVSEDDIAARRNTPAWQALMAYQASRARDYLAHGRTLLPYLDRRSRWCVGAFADLYEAILGRIEASGFDVLDGPPELPTRTKLRLVARGLLR